jgi:hypothetical protein
MLKAVLEMHATQGEILLILRQLEGNTKKKDKEAPASPKTHTSQAAASSSPRLLSPPSNFQLQRELHDANTRINDLQSEVRRVKSSSEARISELEFEVKKVKILCDSKHRTGMPLPQYPRHEAESHVPAGKERHATSPPKHSPLKVKIVLPSPVMMLQLIAPVTLIPCFNLPDAYCCICSKEFTHTFSCIYGRHPSRVLVARSAAPQFNSICGSVESKITPTKRFSHQVA